MSEDAHILRAKLRALLGLQYTPPARAIEARTRLHPDGYAVEDLTLNTGGTLLPATLIRPERAGRTPGVLYCHARSDPALGRSELLNGSPYLQEPAYGAALARLGIAALCVDMPGFGDRRRQGTETELAKTHAKAGGSLFATMLSELAAALGYLRSRDDIHEHRIFTLGFSMGAAHAFWLAALEDGVAGTAHACILADLGPMIDDGSHALLGPALTVAGLLGIAEIGDVAGLAAPMPQLVCHGENDPLTPPAARDSALARLRAAYRHDPDKLQTMIDTDAGHSESAAMRVAVLDFLAQASLAPIPFTNHELRK